MPGKEEILYKADSVLYPEEGTMDIHIQGENIEGTFREWTLNAYKSGTKTQTIVWVTPKVNFNDVAMRTHDMIYYKPAQWHKADIMSYKAVFMGTGFSWGDVLSSDLAYDYTVTHSDSVRNNDTLIYRVVCVPKEKTLYPRIDIVIRAASLMTKKRVYYTASGDTLKTAAYTNIVTTGPGNVRAFTVTMHNRFYNLHNTAKVYHIQQKKLPRFLFDPRNIGRIHAR